MLRSSLFKTAARATLVLVLCVSAAAFSSAPARAQDGGDDKEAMRQKAGELIRQQKFTEALPILEKLAAADPNDAQTQLYLGFALIAQAKVTTDAAARKTLRVRGRQAFVKAKELGYNDPLVDGLIGSLPPDGADETPASQNPEADRLMTEAEALFAQGKLEEALAKYQQALKLDPQLYEAALFSGDVYTQRADYAQAEIWYQKAIAIDPNRELAYRYSATPFMRQKKYDQARDRYVEAFITEPYGRFSVSGLMQWAEATGARLAHPAIDIPTNVTFDEKGDAKINISPEALLGGRDDGSFAWLTYGTTRSAWRKEKFAKTFPNEKNYRHSLAEEADALRAVISFSTADKKQQTQLSPSLAKLKKLDEEGLLEAYILLARADEGIAQDYPAYLRANRDKLRRYVFEYVITGGGR